MSHPRRAFAISPVVIALALLLLGIIAWKVSFQRDLVPASHPRAAAIKSKILTNGATVVIGSTIIAAGVGAGCFFIFGRSQKAANIGVSAWLIVPVSLLTIQAVRTMTGPRPAAPTAATPSPPATSPSPAQASLERMRDQLQKQNERNRETLRNLSTLSQPAPTAPTPASNPPRQPTPAQPSPQVHTPSPLPPARTPPAPKAPNPSSTIALEKLENDINAQAAQILAALEPTLTQIAKNPRTDKADLRKRSEDAAAARTLTDTLAKRFRGITDEARTTLENAGSDNAPHEAHRFSTVIDAHQRAFACESIGRILDQAKEEADFLLANFGQWKTARDGKIESKDFAIQSRANSNRFFIESWLKNKDKELAKLRGE